MSKILLHQEKLPEATRTRLYKDGYIPIQTADPASFRLLDLEPATFTSGDLMWAALDALTADTSYTHLTAYRLMKNMAELATKARAKGTGGAE